MINCQTCCNPICGWNVIQNSNLSTFYDQLSDCGSLIYGWILSKTPTYLSLDLSQSPMPSFETFNILSCGWFETWNESEVSMSAVTLRYAHWNWEHYSHNSNQNTDEIDQWSKHNVRPARYLHQARHLNFEFNTQNNADCASWLFDQKQLNATGRIQFYPSSRSTPTPRKDLRLRSPLNTYQNSS